MRRPWSSRKASEGSASVSGFSTFLVVRAICFSIPLMSARISSSVFSDHFTEPFAPLAGVYSGTSLSADRTPRSPVSSSPHQAILLFR